MTFWIGMFLGSLGGSLAAFTFLALIGKRDDCEWVEYRVDGALYRKCTRVESFEPDLGGWTSGHWDEVK